MENENYELPAKYLTSATALMRIIMTQCGAHSDRAIAHELKVSTAMLSDWKQKFEITLHKKRLEGRIPENFPAKSKENCHFCKFNENPDESRKIPNDQMSPTFGLMQNKSKNLVYNPFYPSKGHSEETLIQEVLCVDDCDLTVVHVHQYFPILLSFFENLTPSVTELNN